MPLPGACWAVVLYVLAGSLVLGDEDASDADAPIPDKVGAEVHLTKKERVTMRKLECSMCKAIINEMHNEVKKHRMVHKGESQIWETSNAICLGLLQKYRLDLAGEKLERKPDDEDDEMAMASMGAGAMDYMRGMLVLKMGCQGWLDDYGGETSGFVYRVVKEDSMSAEASAQEFCVRNVNLCGSKKDEKKKKKMKDAKDREVTRRELRKKEDQLEAKRQEDNPFDKLPEDSKFGLQRMLEMAKDDPFHYMEDDAKARVTKARADLRCDVCRAVIEDIAEQVSKRPKSMQREYDILPLAEGACEGGRDLSVPNYFGVEPPPLPALWTDRHRQHLDKTSGKYRLKHFPKKAAKRRREWRALTVTGQQKPPQADESEGDMMLTMTCKDVLDAARISEKLYERLAVCGSAGAAQPCDAVLATAREVCLVEGGGLCAYATDGPAGAADAGKNVEL